MNIFKKFRAFLRFREAVKVADNAYQKSGQKHYVLPQVDGKLLVMDRKNFRGLRRKGYISRNVSLSLMASHCIYSTCDARGRGGVEQEQLKDRFNDYLNFLDEYGK